jgi:hypothetical protein
MLIINADDFGRSGLDAQVGDGCGAQVLHTRANYAGQRDSFMTHSERAAELTNENELDVG